MDEDIFQLFDRRDKLLLVDAQIKGYAFLEPFEILVPVEEDDLNLAVLTLLTEKPDAFKSQEQAIMKRPGNGIDLGVSLQDGKLLFREPVAHLPGSPLHPFKLSHEDSPSLLKNIGGEAQ
jgi:hypothetical protein